MKIVLIISFILFYKLSFSQLWFDMSAKGGIGTGFLINKTLSDDSRLSVNPGINNFYGGRFGINFGAENSLSLDFTYANNSYSFIQSEIYDVSKTYKYTINYSNFNIASLYRHTNESQYIEIGPEFSFYKKGSISDEANPTTIADVESILNPHLISAIFGVGGYVIGGDNLTLSMGIRFKYTLNNLISIDYTNTNYPFVNYPDITKNATTNPLSAQVVFELNYSLAQFAKASCGKRIALIRL